MKLIYRPTEDWDLPECAQLLQCGPAREPAAARLLETWRGLRSRGALNSAVMEDQERHPGQRLVHFGASVFVTDEFAREARARHHPCPSDILLDGFRAGRSQILEAPAIRRANAGNGLTVFVLHQAMAPELRPEERQTVMMRAPDTFFLVHQGFNLKEILLQVSGPDAQRFLLASGFHLRDERTGLFGLTRAEAQAQPGAYAARLFACEPPRLRFHVRDQQLLHRALLGETDLEISEVLGLAPDTVKARWRAIYGRVAEQAPELLPEDEARPCRGAEKRRRLLHYLRHHPEELRPN